MDLTSAHLLSLAQRRGSHHDFHTYLCNPAERRRLESYKAVASPSEFSVLLGYCCEIAHKPGGFLAFLHNYYFVSDPALSLNVRRLVSAKHLTFDFESLIFQEPTKPFPIHNTPLLTN